MNLEELKKLCAEATPAPWLYRHKSDTWHAAPDQEEAPATYGRCIMHLAPDDREMHLCDRDIAFIAAAREAMPKLIAVAEAAKHLCDKTFVGDIDSADDLVKALAAMESDE